MATTHIHHTTQGREVVDHEHGSMDIIAHERTFDGFVRFMTWAAALAILVLIFLALANS